jgi:formate hydrogenlyase subunit 6/NADH:ubiquinone oxidoreductase subunit I
MMKYSLLPTIIRNLFKKPMTVCFPHEKIEIPEDYRGEHSYDINLCTSCKLCAKICLNKAIEMITAPEELRERYPKTYPQIDLGKCCFCALCADICPKKAIKMTKNVFLATFDKETVIKSPFANIQ